MQVITNRFEAIGWLFSLLGRDDRLDVIDARFESPCLALEIVDAWPGGWSSEDATLSPPWRNSANHP